MFSKIRKRVTYANVTMTLALVFAMTGGAYAAKHYLITSTKQISPNVLKQLKGAKGPKGDTGAAGPQGAQGPTGAAGKDGANGKDGAAGSNGVSVTSAESKAKIGPCKEGGSEFLAAESKKTYACNGTPGKDGSPWAAGGTLPEGSTEKGVWTAMPVESPFKTFTATSAISFVVPLASAPTLEYIKVGEAGKEHAVECPGTVEDPKAKEGFLCVYAESAGFGGVLEEISPTTTYAAGAFLQFTAAAAGFPIHGTWAVTG